MEALEDKPERIELEAEWENMLGHQLPALPPFEQFWQELISFFQWLHGIAKKVARPAIQVAAVEIDETWRPPSMAYAWHTSIPLEIIRFAAANRLCVDLAYQGSRRLIEPYSLRRTRDGNLLLYAVKHETGKARSYRVDRIQGAEITRTSFIPRYLVDLTPVGPVSAPPVTRASTYVSRPMVSRSRTGARSVRRTASSGPRYVFRCTICGKQFTRGSYNATLNPHKNKQGYPCPGRVGLYVTTKYR